MKYRLLPFTLFFLFAPGFVLAELSSTNYTVTNYAVSGWGQSGNATSTNYDWDLESGGYYTYDATTVDDDGGSDSHHAQQL